MTNTQTHKTTVNTTAGIGLYTLVALLTGQLLEIDIAMSI